MLRESFWWPDDLKRGVLLVAILLMVVLHQSELVGILGSPVLVFGWLPIQLAYDVLFNLAGVAVLYAMYRLAPEPPADVFEDDARTDPSTETTEVNADGR